MKKRIIIQSLFCLTSSTLLITSQAHAAARFWDGTDTTADADGGDGTWNTINTNWDTAATGGIDTTFGTNNQATFGGPAGTIGTVTLENDIASGTITGTGGATTGALNFGANTTYLITGGGTTRTITTGAAIQINGNGGTFDTDVNLALGGMLTLTNGGTCTINGAISGAQGITKGGGGTYILGGENSSYTGVTQINQGFLAASSIKNVGGGNSSFGAPTTTANGRIGLGSAALIGTMRYTGGTQSTNRDIFLSGTTGGGGIDMSGTGTFTITGALTVAGGLKTLILSGSTEGIGEFQGAIGGTGGNATSLVKNGSGTWRLPGTKAFTGSVTINDGILDTTVLANGGSSSSIGSSTNVETNLILNGGTLKFTGAIGSTNRLFSLQSSSTIEGSGSFPLNFSNTGTMGFNGGTDAKTLTLTGSNSGTNNISAIIGDNVGATSVFKTGAGSWRLSGANTYTGTTTIDNGILLVNSPGSLDAASAVSVNNGTLGGDGTINGSVTVAAVGKLAPGATVSTLAIGGGLDISATAGGTGTLEYELGPIAASDKITVTGTLSIGAGALGFNDFVFTNLGGLEAGTYKLITSGGISGGLDSENLTGMIGDFSAVLQITGNDLELNVTAPVGTPYETWSGNLPADEDANGDGVKNGVAWALGASGPNVNAIGLLPTLDNTSDETYVIFTFNRSDQANVDENTAITVEYGTDLLGWTTAVDDGDNVIIVVTGGDPTDAVQVKLKRSTLAEEGRIFARLKVLVTP